MNRRDFALLAAGAALAGCTVPEVDVSGPKYTGPEVTRIIVNKGDRRMFLLHVPLLPQ